MEIKILNMKDQTIGTYTFKQFDILIDLGLGGTIPNNGNEIVGDILLRDNQLKMTKTGQQYIVAKQFKLHNSHNNETFYMAGTKLSNAIQQKALEIINNGPTPHSNNVAPTPEAQELMNQPTNQEVKQEQQVEEINLDDIKF